MKIKIHPNVYLTETARSFNVKSNYRNEFTRKHNSVTVKKTGDVTRDLKALEEAKASVINHYEEMEYKSAVGVIVPDKEYTIRGMNYVAGKQGQDKERIEVKIAVQRRGMSAFSRSVSTYKRFVEVWDEATIMLMKFHSLESKPVEWEDAPSELYFKRLQERLIKYKGQP